MNFANEAKMAADNMRQNIINAWEGKPFEPYVAPLPERPNVIGPAIYILASVENSGDGKFGGGPDVWMPTWKHGSFQTEKAASDYAEASGLSWLHAYPISCID